MDAGGESNATKDNQPTRCGRPGDESKEQRTNPQIAHAILLPIGLLRGDRYALTFALVSTPIRPLTDRVAVKSLPATPAPPQRKEDVAFGPAMDAYTSGRTTFFVNAQAAVARPSHACSNANRGSAVLTYLFDFRMLYFPTRP
jgi:hypothetical protein